MKPLLPLLAPLGFVLLWCALCFVIALTSGWRGLAARFRASHTPPGRKFSMQRALINSARFGGVLTFIVGPEGLYLRLWPLFGLFGLAAPPLLIPWSELSPLQSGRWTWFETWTTTATLGRFSKVPIALLDRNIAQAVAEFLPPHAPHQPQHQAAPTRTST